MPRKLIAVVFALMFALFTFAPLAAQDAPLTVIATTTILADVARNIGGDAINVESLLPPDADTHAYEPTAEDAARLTDADLLLVVGIGYEEFLGDLLMLAGTDTPVVEVSTGLEILEGGADVHEGEEHDAEEADHEEGEEHDAADVIGVYGTDDLECAHEEDEEASAKARYRFARYGISTDQLDGIGGDHDDEDEDEHGHGACDPHVWMNPLNVITWANTIADAFAAADSANADLYRENAAAYAAQLEALDLEITQLLAEIPDERRVLVTNHEFMGYFAAHYGFEVAATVLPGSQTAAEPDPQALAELITLIETENVPAIFAEVSANADIAQLIADESGVVVVSTLFSESLSGADGAAPTYIDMIRANATTIADVLR